MWLGLGGAHSALDFPKRILCFFFFVSKTIGFSLPASGAGGSEEGTRVGLRRGQAEGLRGDSGLEMGNTWGTWDGFCGEAKRRYAVMDDMHGNAQLQTKTLISVVINHSLTVLCHGEFYLLFLLIYVSIMLRGKNVLVLLLLVS